MSGATLGSVEYTGSGTITKLAGVMDPLVAPGWTTPGGETVEITAELTAWATANGIDEAAFASDKAGDNGLTAYQSYALGVNVGEDVEVKYAATATAMTFTTQKAANLSDAVSYTLYKDGAAIDGTSVDTTSGDFSGVYQLQAKVTDGDGIKVVETDKIGVRVVADTAAAGTYYLSVPFTAIGSDEGVAPTAIVENARLAEDDQILVYGENGWEAYLYDGSKWEFVESELVTKPTVTKLARGSAVKLVKAAGSYPVYTVGGYSEAAVATSVAKGANLIGNPTGAAFTPNAATLGTTMTDLVRDPSDGASFQYYNGAWKKFSQTVVNGRLKTTYSDATAIGAGKAFFFTTSSPKSINW